MTREDIIQMAQEAKMPFYWRTGEITYLDKLVRFATLVASAEREACAKIGDDHPSWSSRMYSATIRARGQE
jgi:hypothetical protein